MRNRFESIIAGLCGLTIVGSIVYVAYAVFR